uniref:Uncharacterized protein n=1 Tax=Onchocerca volvulus TaxID=6282 RepID=A0A8R1Y5S1_ONCVO
MQASWKASKSFKHSCSLRKSKCVKYRSSGGVMGPLGTEVVRVNGNYNELGRWTIISMCAERAWYKYNM